jgi:hypothetical protein
MANIKISDLTAAAAVLGTQEFEVNDSLTSKKVTAAQILAYINANAGAVDLTSAQTITGVKTFSNPIVGSVTGNAATATALQAARTIGGVSFDGTANINLPGVNTAGNQNTSGSAVSVSGTTTAAINTSALGSGTASSSTFLRGDRTFTTLPSSAPTTAQVLAATAGASVGAVGTYAFLGHSAVNVVNGAGSTRAGSGLRYAGIRGASAFTANYSAERSHSGNGGTPAGTWRCMGRANVDTADGNAGATLWLRIS